MQRDPPPPDDACLGLTFMAAAPRGPSDVLDYEGEENAILAAVGTLPVDLVVEESGNPDLLAERLAELEAMQVLHLSCHGHSEPRPVLQLEDEEGDPLPTDAAELIETFGAHRPRLAFVSACLSAAGLLIHGLGRLGKSSLAARLAHRRAHDLKLVVVFGRYDAVTIADEIRAECPAARDIIDGARGRLRDNPEALEDVLRDALEGPCAQSGGGTPVLLVIDDMERILEAPPEAGPWRMKAASQPVLRAVLRAFDRAATDSRLLLTSRYTVTLPDGGVDLAERLHALHLPPMDVGPAQAGAAAAAGGSGRARGSGGR